jgi:hypothetical protein
MLAFFKSTADGIDQFTNLFDFSWAAIPALWNLRWQVAGFLREVSSATDADLRARFVLGSGVQGANLRRACVDTGWEEQQSRFASIMLTNAFSIYEHWADEVLREIQSGQIGGRRLQFPDSKAKPGFIGTIQGLTANVSPTLDGAFYPIFSSQPKYSWQHAANLLLCFRYFKEARNSEIHHGGRASDAAADASAAFVLVSSKQHLGMKGSLDFVPLAKGQPVSLSVRGVVGFCDVLIRLMITADAELCRVPQAERLLEHRLRNAKREYNTLAANRSRREYHITRRCAAAGLPRPANANLVYKFMVGKGIVKV